MFLYDPSHLEIFDRILNRLSTISASTPETWLHSPLLVFVNDDGNERYLPLNRLSNYALARIGNSLVLQETVDCCNKVYGLIVELDVDASDSDIRNALREALRPYIIVTIPRSKFEFVGPIKTTYAPWHSSRCKMSSLRDLVLVVTNAYGETVADLAVRNVDSKNIVRKHNLERLRSLVSQLAQYTIKIIKMTVYQYGFDEEYEESAVITLRDAIDDVMNSVTMLEKWMALNAMVPEAWIRI